jgi:hypothetical protein
VSLANCVWIPEAQGSTSFVHGIVATTRGLWPRRNPQRSRIEHQLTDNPAPPEGGGGRGGEDGPIQQPVIIRPGFVFALVLPLAFPHLLRADMLVPGSVLPRYPAKDIRRATMMSSRYSSD